MKQTEYRRAVDKLEFSEITVGRLAAKKEKRPGLHMVRRGLIAAVLAGFMVTTAFGAVSFLHQRPADVVPLGTEAQEMIDAKFMEFTLSEISSGVNVHYMELNPKQQYGFRHGMLWSGNLGYQHITDDYRLEPAEMNRVGLKLEKNDRVYTLGFDYLETEQGILSNHRSVYHKDENGEILLNATDGRSGQWPVYFHLESGTIRDALPEWAASDFEGRVGYGYSLMGGVLMATVVNDRQPDTHSVLYWIGPGAEEAKVIELPGKGTVHVEQDTIFYQNEVGQLFRMNEDFQFEFICEYETMDALQDGLLTVCADGKLGILDAYTGELYVFDQIKVSREDTMDYHAVRYDAEGTIALVQTEWRHDPERRGLCSLGVLDRVSAELKLLEIEHDLDGYQHGWLDEYRFAVVYRAELSQILCVYEFDA